MRSSKIEPSRAGSAPRSIGCRKMRSLPWSAAARASSLTCESETEAASSNARNSTVEDGASIAAISSWMPSDSSVNRACDSRPNRVPSRPMRWPSRVVRPNAREEGRDRRWRPKEPLGHPPCRMLRQSCGARASSACEPGAARALAATISPLDGGVPKLSMVRALCSRTPVIVTRSGREPLPGRCGPT